MIKIVLDNHLKRREGDAVFLHSIFTFFPTLIFVQTSHDLSARLKLLKLTCKYNYYKTTHAEENNSGNIGNTGNTGNNGKNGNTGKTGNTGNSGNVGNTGNSGNKGNTGNTNNM